MSFPRYERYKDSNYGNGEIPITWSEVRLKTILAQKITDGPHETPDFTEFGIPFLSVDGIQNGELVFAGCRYISEESHWLYRKKVQPRRDDILLAKAASTGKIARVKTDIEFNIWSPLAVIRLDTSRSIPAFVEYVLQSPESQAQVEMLCTANTQKNISMDDIPLIAFALPPRDIQSAIVTFLQRETAKIDALIEEQRRLIELLKEKRQAVISHTITKGLNPDVKMWDTSIKWIGKIPLGWTVTHVKYAVASVVDCLHTTPTYDGELFYPAIRTADVEPGRLLLSQARLVSEEVYLERVQRLEPNAGDILYSREGERFGMAALVPPLTKLCLGQRMMMLRPDPSFDPGYLMWAMNSSAVYQQVLEGVTGPTAPHVNIGEVINFVIPAPPLTEQQNMSKYIDTLVTRIDDLVARAQDGIGLLEERRRAVISAAVTGKIDVRNYTPKEAA